MNKSLMTRSALLAVFVALVAGTIFLLVQKNETNTTQDDKLQVVATYYPLYEFSKQVGGDKVQVQNMTPDGVEPHDFEPTPSQLANAQKAAVFVYNGAHFEHWTDGFLGDFKGEKVLASSGLELLQAKEEDGDELVSDPHFWLDPLASEKVVQTIADSFSKKDAANKEFYQANAAAYKEKLRALDAEFSKGLQNCSLRTIVTSHEAFAYMAKRYNFELQAIAGINAEEDPSAAQLAELAELVKQKGIGYVFFESTISPKLAETLANETGAKTAILEPIEGLSEDDQKAGKNYITLQQENLKALRLALACQ